jgi:DNA-binding response OmpR family regulator
MSGISLGNVTIDRDRFEVWVDVRRVDLTFVEFELLYHLAKNEGKVLARAKLMQAVWNEPSRGQDRKLTVHMSRLRKKMSGSSPGVSRRSPSAATHSWQEPHRRRQPTATIRERRLSA